MDPILTIWQRRLFQSKEAKRSTQRDMTAGLSENISGMRINMMCEI